MECAMKTKHPWKIDRCHFWWLCPSQTDLSCSLQRMWGPVEEKLYDPGWWTTFQVDWTQWYCGLRNPAPPWVVGTLSTIVYIYHISTGAGFRNQLGPSPDLVKIIGSPVVTDGCFNTNMDQLSDDLGYPQPLGNFRMRMASPYKSGDDVYDPYPTGWWFWMLFIFKPNIGMMILRNLNPSGGWLNKEPTKGLHPDRSQWFVAKSRGKM